jgi:hypothetical protein
MTEITKSRPHQRRLNPADGGRRADQAELVIAQLLQGGRLIDIAPRCGIAAGTLRDWLRADWFRERYAAARQELLHSTIDRLRSAGGDAVELLHKVVRSPKLATTPRVQAARGLLEVLLRAIELQDLAARIEKLEAATKGDRL